MRSLFLFCLVGILSLCLQAQENSFSLLNVLPERTLVVLGSPDVSNAAKAFTQTNLYKLSQDPEVNRFLQPILEMLQPEIQKGLKEFEKNMGMSLEETLKVISGELMVAVVDVIPGNNMPLGAVLSLEFGSNQKSFMQLLSLIQQKGRMRFAEQKFEGISLYETAKAPVCYAIIDNTFVLASKKELMEELILSYVGKAKEAFLKDNPHAKKVASVLFQCDTKEENVENQEAPQTVPAFVFYLNTENAFARFGKVLPPPVMKMVEDLKIQDIRSLSMSLNFQGKDMHSKFYLYAPGTKEGIHKLYQGDAVNVKELAKNIPDFSSAYSCGKLNLVELFNTVENLLQVLDPQGQMGFLMAYKQAIGAAEEALKFSLKDDFSATFMGDTFSFAFLENNLFSESVSAIPVKDKEKAEKCLQSLASLLKIEKKSVDLDGKTYYYFVNPLGKLGDNPFKKMERIKDPIAAIQNALSYGFSGMAYLYDGEYLYLGQTLQGLSYYMQWRSNTKVSLAERKDFISSIPQGKHLSFLYYNPQPAIQIWWNTLRSLVRYFEGYIRGAGIPLETSLLPRAQTLASYFTQGTIAVSLNEDGILISSKGPLDAMILGVGAIGVGAAVAIPNLIKAREKAQDAALMAKLRTLSTAIQLYNVEYGKYPPCGEELFKELIAKQLLGSFDVENYECTAIPLEFYHENPNFPIVWAKKENNKGERVVLYFNGTVEKLYRYKFNWLISDAQKLYKKSQKK